MFECSLMALEISEAAMEEIWEAIPDDAERTKRSTVMRSIERKQAAEEAAEQVAA